MIKALLDLVDALVEASLDLVEALIKALLNLVDALLQAVDPLDQDGLPGPQLPQGFDDLAIRDAGSDLNGMEAPRQAPKQKAKGHDPGEDEAPLAGKPLHEAIIYERTKKAGKPRLRA